MASIRKRPRSDGTSAYAVLYSIGGRQTSTTFPTQAAAEKFRSLVDNLGAERAMEVAGIPGTHRAQTDGMGETVEGWLTHYINHLTGVTKFTIYNYRLYLRCDIAPVLGHVKLAELSHDEIAVWVQNLQERGLSGKTIENRHGLLSAGLNAAVRAKRIPVNPAAGARLPRTERGEMVFLTREQFARLLRATDERWRPMVEFMVTSGARFGEVSALRPADVDRQSNTVRIQRAWKRVVPGGYELGTTKTTRSRRTINIPASVLNKLDYSGRWLFTTPSSGGPVRIDNFRQHVWHPALTRAQLDPRPRIHDLRHTCASWLIQQGVPLPVVQAHLGHENIKITVGTYGHLDRASHVAASEAMQRMLG